MNLSSQNGLDLRASRLFQQLRRKLWEYRFPFFAALLFGLFSHMFFFTNKLTNIDDISYLFSKGNSANLGRWGLDLLSFILPDASIPWFHGTLTILFLAVSVCLILSLLEIRSPLLQVLSAGLIVSFPSLTGTFGYMYTSSSYGAAFLLSVLSVCLLSTAGWNYAAAGLVCGVLSLSVYQSYISVTVSLMLLVLIRRTMYCDTPVRRIFFSGLWYLGALALCLGLYAVLTPVIQHLMGVSMISYADNAFGAGSDLLMRPVNCILALAYVFLFGYRGLIHEGTVQILHLICLGILGFEILFWMFRSRKKERICMLVFLLLLLPFGLNSILLFVSMRAGHSLVLYGIVCIYLLFALVLQNSPRLLSGKKGLDRFRAFLLDFMILSMAVTIYSNSSTANRAALNLHMRYENNYSAATSLITQLEMLPGFTEDTPVALVGEFPMPNDYDHLLDVSQITGVSGDGTAIWEPSLFLRSFCGADFHYLSSGDSMKLINDPEFQSMPIFPDHGSVRMIGEIAAVKLDPWNLPEEYLQLILPQNH